MDPTIQVAADDPDVAITVDPQVLREEAVRVFLDAGARNLAQ
jgi:hypothetical protein